MKKVYTKPVIVIEDFSLSASIAGNCEQKSDIQTYGVCGLDFGGDIIFLSEANGCSELVETDDGAYNGICYHNPSDLNNVFNS